VQIPLDFLAPGSIGVVVPRTRIVCRRFKFASSIGAPAFDPLAGPFPSAHVPL
jgi:hypothetical protein